MKFEEILPALREGKKIIRDCWGKDNYYFLNEDYCLKTKEGAVATFLTLPAIFSDDWEIVKEPKKVKLRDLTKEQYEKWRENNCKKYGEKYGDCNGCPFQKVQCYNDNRVNNIWYLNKDLYSDKFLDQEIEVEE